MSRITTFFEALSAGRRVRKHLQRDMQALGIRLSRPKIRFPGSSPYLYDCEISRHGSRYTLDFTGDSTSQDLRRVASLRASTFTHWLWHCPLEVGSITVNMSDGDYPSGARFAASVREPRFIPLPDAFFFDFRGIGIAASRRKRTLFLGMPDRAGSDGAEQPPAGERSMTFRPRPCGIAEYCRGSGWH